MQKIRAGQRYRTTVPLRILGTTQWFAPFTGGFECTLPADEIFVIEFDPPDHATAACCKPERYEELHHALVPEIDWSADKYGGYSLVIPLDVIQTCEAVGP